MPELKVQMTKILCYAGVHSVTISSQTEEIQTTQER
jgi:hypothetical protein